MSQKRVADEPFECPGAPQIQADAIGVTAVLKDQGKPSWVGLVQSDKGVFHVNGATEIVSR